MEMSRPISPNEVAVVNWLLDHALVEVAGYRDRPVEELRVVGGCGCGCSSIDFIPPQQQAKQQILADELALYPDGQQAGVMLWGKGGEIALLEVYDFEPGSSHRFPDVSHLCTWEELGRRSLRKSSTVE